MGLAKKIYDKLFVDEPAPQSAPPQAPMPPQAAPQQAPPRFPQEPPRPIESMVEPPPPPPAPHHAPHPALPETHAAPHEKPPEHKPSPLDQHALDLIEKRVRDSVRKEKDREHQETRPAPKPAPRPSAPKPLSKPEPKASGKPEAGKLSETRLATLQRLLNSVNVEEPKGWSEQPAPFHLRDGTVLRGKKDLERECHRMAQDIFEHHVNAQRNDFANWLADVFGEYELASKVRNAHTPKELAHILSEHRETTKQQRDADEDISVLRDELSRLRRAIAQEIAAGIEEVRVERDKLREEHDAALSTLQEAAMIRGELDEQKKELQKSRLALKKEESKIPKKEESKDPKRAEHKASKKAVTQEKAKIPEPLINEGVVVEDAGMTKEMLLERIADAKRLLLHGRSQEARAAYGAIRDAFAEMRLSREDKQELFNLIRELYTEVELARL